MYSEKRTQPKRSRRAARKKSSRAGGKWGDQFRERLHRLITARSQSNASFARRCGIHAPRLTEWLSGEQIPSTESLRAITNATNVSSDWLLEGKGYDGKPSMEPVYRGQWRSDPGVEADLAELLSLSLQARGVEIATRLTINVKQIIDDVTATLESEADDWKQIESSVTARIIANSDNLTQMLSELSRYVDNTPEAYLRLQMTAQAAAILEEQVANDQRSRFRSITRYLFPKEFHEPFTPEELERVNIRLHRAGKKARQHLGLPMPTAQDRQEIRRLRKAIRDDPTLQSRVIGNE